MTGLSIATREGLLRARKLLDQVASRNELVLFAARDLGVVEKAAERARMPWVAGRWMPGTLTNFQMTRASVARLVQLESWARDGTIRRYSKPERATLEREKRRLIDRFGGLRAVYCLPKVLVLVDASRQRLAVTEARKVRAATVGLGETNEKVDVLVPGATDAVARTVLDALADAVLQATPPHEQRVRKRRRPRDDDDDPGAAAVPARLRPPPTPGRASAKRRPPRPE